MKHLFFIFLSTFVSHSFGQVSERKHIDEANGYSVVIPSWLNEKNQDAPDFFGGTMPAVKGIENAIVVTALEKNKFESFEDFQRIYITGNKFGQPSLFSEHHVWYGSNERDLKKIDHGVSCRIFLFYDNKIYHNQFVLLETSKSYLLVNFTASPETYEENLPKFKEFMKGLLID